MIKVSSYLSNIYVVFFISFFIYNLSNTPTASALVFDLYIFVWLFLSLLIIGKNDSLVPKALSFWIIFILLSYSIVNYYFLLGHSNHYEFFRSSRFLFYMLIFSYLSHLSRNVDVYKVDILEWSNNYSKYILIFLSFYAVNIVFFDDLRPGFYSENNFEIPSLLLIGAFIIHHEDRLTKKNNILISLVVFLSMSKSGVLELFSLYFTKLNKRKLAMYVVFISFCVALVLIVFLMRDTGESSDRYRFMMNAMNLLNEKGLYNWLFGIGIGQQLPYVDCLELSFYAERMFENPLYCNSVIYHSFGLKILVEMGLLGSLLVFSLWFFMLKESFGFKIAISYFSIIFISSLSVSGFSNSIIIWPLFYILMKKSLYISTLRKRGEVC